MRMPMVKTEVHRSDKMEDAMRERSPTRDIGGEAGRVLWRPLWVQRVLCRVQGSLPSTPYVGTHGLVIK